MRSALTRLPELSPSIHVVAAGKAAWAMYAAAAPVIGRGSAVVASTAPPELAAAEHVESFVAGHPAPNDASVAAGERALQLAARSRSDGGLLVLLSGGASAMLAAPSQGISLRDKLETAHALMQAGAAIHELNCVRKHLSRVKGGRLAVAAGRTLTLALSDVHGPIADDPSVIGSGPTVPDATTFADALAILQARGVRAPDAVRRHLERGLRGEVEETPKPGDARLENAEYRVIGSRQTAVAGAKEAAERRGYRVAIVAEATVGEAREAGSAFAARALAMLRDMQPPVCVIGSGETTVTVTGKGSGGRNQEFALGGAQHLEALFDRSSAPQEFVLASAGTDGIDGPTDAAGAIVDRTTLARASRLGLDAAAALARNDTYPFFDACGDLLRWGATGTNVGDLHVLLIA